MTQVRWTLQAAEDLEAIHEFIARDSVHYARLVVERLIHAIDQLERFPDSGRVVPELGGQRFVRSYAVRVASFIAAARI